MIPKLKDFLKIFANFLKSRPMCIEESRIEFFMMLVIVDVRCLLVRWVMHKRQHDALYKSLLLRSWIWIRHKMGIFLTLFLGQKNTCRWETGSNGLQLCVEPKSTSPHLRGNNQLLGAAKYNVCSPYWKGWCILSTLELRNDFSHWIGLDWIGNWLISLVFASQANCYSKYWSRSWHVIVMRGQKEYSILFETIT